MAFDPSLPVEFIDEPPAQPGGFDPSLPVEMIDEGGNAFMDVPVNIGSGVITGVKGITDLFGANNPVSQNLAQSQQWYQDRLSPEAKADQIAVAQIMREAEGKGVGAEALAGLRAFTVAPIDMASQAVGTMAPVVATGAAGKVLGLGAKGVQAAQVAMGAGQGAGIVKGEIYNGTKQHLIDSGIDPATAERVAAEAQSYGGKNLDQILLGAGLGAAASAIGAEKIMADAITKKGARVTSGIIANALKTGIKEGAPEFLQGGQEQLAQNLALSREGFAVDPMRGVVAQGTMEGLAGAMVGAPVGAAESLDNRNAPPVQRPAPAVVAPVEVTVPAVPEAELADAFGPIEQPAGPPINIPAAEPSAPVEAPAPAVEPPATQLATPADPTPVEAAQVGAEGGAQIVPAVQETAVVPSYQQDLEAAKDIKDAKGRSQIVTPAQAAKMSDEKLLIAYGGAAVAMQNGGDSPLSRVNIAAWHNELVKRGLMEPSPAISSYAVTAQPQSPVVGDGRQGEAQNLQSEQQPSPASKNAGSSENVAAPASYLGKPYDPAALAEKAKRDGYELVYHGDRNQPMQEGYKPWDSANLPLFTSADPEAASWYGEPRPLFIKSSKIATEQDLVAAARKVGVKGTYGQPGEEVNIPEVSKVSSYEGYNQNDLVYIPRVREELVRQGFDAVKVWDQLERDEIEATIIIGSPDQVVDPLAEPAQPQPAAAAVDAAVMPDASNVLAGEQNAAKTPKVGEVIGTTSDGRIEFVMAKGLLEGRPDMFTVGLRSAGSNAAPEPGGYGHNTNKDRVLERFVEKESGANAIISSPYVKAMADARAKAAAEAKSKKDAADKARQDEEQRNREAKAAYDASVAATPLPKGEQAMLTVQQNDGSTRLEPSTRYGDFAIRKIGGKKAKYQIDHWHSGLKVVDADSLGEAKTLVRAFIHSGADMSVRAPSKEDVALLAQVVVHQRSGGMPLPQVKGSGQVTGQDAGQVAPTIKTRLKRNLKSNSGALDAEILADLVEYGKQFYRAGMTFGKWASQMVKEFGQGVSKWLRQAYDSIVKAYKDSPWSSEAGAVNMSGNLKPRRFEERVKASEEVSQEVKDQVGSLYESVSLRGVQKEAAAWIDAKGIDGQDGALMHILGKKKQDSMSALDNAIGIDLAMRLQAMNRHVEAGIVYGVISEKAQSSGQANATLKLLGGLSPESIGSYMQDATESAIQASNESLKAELRAAQADLLEAKKQLAEARQKSAEHQILKGKVAGQSIDGKIKARFTDPAEARQVRVSLRSVLTSNGTRAEIEAGAIKVLTDAGMPQGEATSIGKAIVRGVYDVLTTQKKRIVSQVKDAHGWRARSNKQLIQKLMDGEISDNDFLANLTRLAGLPSVTLEMAAKLRALTQEFKAAPDEKIKLSIAAQIFEEIKSVVPASLGEKLRAFTYLSMLSFPLTWVVNVGGNTILANANAMRDGIILGTDKFVTGRATGRRRYAGGLHLRERIKGLAAPYQDYVAGRDWNKQYANGTPYENRMAGLRHMRMMAKLTTQNKWDISDAKEVGRRVFTSKFMNGWQATIEIALGAFDRAFWESAFRASLAAREAAAKENGEWQGFHSADDFDGAWADAARAIFQDPNVVSWAAKETRAVMNFGQPIGAGTGVLPFAQVVGSIAKRGGFDLNVPGFLNALWQTVRPVLFKTSGGKYGGRFNQEAFNTAFAEALAGGVATVGLGYFLYAQGIISAGRDDDEDVEAAKRELGLGAYRINLTALMNMLRGNLKKHVWAPEDVTIPYDWAQPVAIPLAMGADMAAQIESDRLKGIRTGINQAMAKSAFLAGIQSVEDLPVISGLAQFARNWNNYGIIDAFAMAYLQLPGQMVPQPIRKVGQFIDNTQRETRGGDPYTRPFRQIASSLPVLSWQLPARIGVTGQVVERRPGEGPTLYSGGPEAAAWNFLKVIGSPFLVSRVKNDPVLQEVNRLMQTTGETRQFPRQVSRTATVNGQPLRLTDEQLTAYQYYLGNYTMAQFQWRMQSPRYRQLPDIEKVKVFAQDLQDINAAVKSALLGEDPRRLSRKQRAMRARLLNSPLGQSRPPTSANP